MKRAIVTGANGFVGSALVKELLKHDIEVICLDRQGCCGNLPDDERVTFIEHDLDKSAMLEDVLAPFNADIMYHFAWAGSAGPQRADTELQLKNAQWTIDCLRLAKKVGCKRFVCAGSIMEHETISAAYAQGNKPGMAYVYGSGKLVAHTMAMSVAADIGIDLIWAKITNAYGAGELSPRFINTTIRKILNDEPLQFTAATQNYDFVYIDDVARAFYLIGKNGKPFSHYLIGSSNASPLKQFILQIKESIGQDKEFIFGDVPFTGINMPLEDFDCTKTFEDTGFKAQISFIEGIRLTTQWIKEQDAK